MSKTNLFVTILLLAAMMFASVPTAKADLCLVGDIVEVKVTVDGKAYDTGFCHRLPEKPVKTFLYVGKERTKYEVTVKDISITLHEMGKSDRTATLRKVRENLYKANF